MSGPHVRGNGREGVVKVKDDGVWLGFQRLAERLNVASLDELLYLPRPEFGGRRGHLPLALPDTDAARIKAGRPGLGANLAQQCLPAFGEVSLESVLNGVGGVGRGHRHLQVNRERRDEEQGNV